MKLCAEGVFMKKWLISILIICQSFFCFSQRLPVDTWESYFSFNSSRGLSITNTKAFSLSENGVQVYDLQNGSLSKITTTEGLYSGGLSSIYFSEAKNLLFLGYNDGTIDLISEDNIKSLETLRELNVTGTKRINHFFETEKDVYISSELGLIRLDLTQNELTDIYQEIGPQGIPIQASESIVISDLIYLVTDIGIQTAQISANLLDFNNWQHTLLENSEIKGLTSFKENAWFIQNENQIGFINDSLNIIYTLDDVTLIQLQSINESLYTLSTNSIVQLSDEKPEVVINGIFEDAADFDIANENYWISDSEMGLIRIENENSWESIKLNSPLSDQINVLKSTSNELLLSYNQGSNHNSQLSIFTGTWEHFNLDSVIVKTALSYNNQIIAATDQGLFNVTAEENIYESDAPISDLVIFNNQIWASVYGGSTSLLNLEGENIEEFPSSITGSDFPASLRISNEGSIWQIKDDPEGGIAVWEPESDQFRRLTSSDGILSNSITDIAINYDDEVWILSSNGIASFFDASFVFNDENASEILFQGEPLLQGIEKNDIEFDGGNRVWIGTNEGIWVFNSILDEEVYQFSVENSPLPSNRILDIEYQQTTGLVYILTDKGLVAYQSNSSEPKPTHNNVKIFPNPAVIGMNSAIVFEGLAANVRLKITSVDGRLVQEIEANGSTASWNLINYRGQSVNEGIYLVFSSTADGEETFIGKFAIVND